MTTKLNARLTFDSICKKAGNGYWALRIIAETEYLLRLYGSQKAALPDPLLEAISYLSKVIETDDTITKSAALSAEAIMAALSPDAKSLSMIFAAHAHVDMNWEWGAPETATVVIDTFQTMLNLMEEYPAFYFSQSQASTYEIVEKYCPSMLPQIKSRVQEGRWEVTASTWVEPDKNMSGTEAMARHILYTKRYLSHLFDISMDDLNIDFEPDTFGHSENIPEILTQGGVKYYYHCRGLDGDKQVYRWRAPSGAEILCFSEPHWYASEVGENFIIPIPEYCEKNHVKTFLCIYGVGDHGGGPTRRDIERILDMASWPLTPNIRMGTFGEFFREAEKHWEELPVIDHELNCVFTGCYTTQARLKRANRLGEDRFYDAEALSALAGLEGDTYTNLPGFETGWRKLLFNQFHDILPGSCVQDSCYHALGTSQEAMSGCLANANRSMKFLTEKINTALFGGETDPHSTSEGAGVGHNAMDSHAYGINVSSRTALFPFASRSSGRVRPIVVFNTLSWEREDVTEITLWDWEYPIRQTEILDVKGQSIPFDVLEENAQYWFHRRTTLDVKVRVPALGYTCLFARYNPGMTLKPIASPRYGEDGNAPILAHSALVIPPVTTPRVTGAYEGQIILENELVKAAFDGISMKLISLLDKRTNTEIVTSDRPSCYFRLVLESDAYGRSAWTVGNYALIKDLNGSEFLYLEPRETRGVMQSVSYRISFGAGSSIRVTVSLPQGSCAMRFSVNVDWRETGEKGGATPQLQFYVPFGFKANDYRYDIPGGVIVRPAINNDVPAIGWSSPIPENGDVSLLVGSDCKYGYRGDSDAIIVNLLRAAYFPDPTPDIGLHQFALCVSPLQGQSDNEARSISDAFSHPLIPCPCGIHHGELPPSAGLFTVSGPAQAVSLRWEDNHAVLRLCASEQGGNVTVSARKPIDAAYLSDINETIRMPIKVTDNVAHLTLTNHAIRTLILEFM